MLATTLRHIVLMLAASASIMACKAPPPAPPPPPAAKPGAVIGGFKLQRNAVGDVIGARPMSASETQEEIRRHKAGDSSGRDTLKLTRE